MSSNGEFMFTWMVESFKLYPQKNGQCIRSPNFMVKQFLDTVWCLELYPRGIDSNSMHYVSCFLCKSKDYGPQEIGINFQLSISSVTNKGTNCFAKESFTSGWPQFILRSSVEGLYDCVVECCMRMRPILDEVDIIEEPSQYLVPCSLQQRPIMPSFIKETILGEGENISKIGLSVAPYSSQRFARTRASVEKIIFTCAIKDYLHPEWNMRQLIPVAAPFATLSLALFIRKKDKNEFLCIEVCLKNKRKSVCQLICKIELIDSKKRILNSIEKDHIFECDDENWDIGYPFKWTVVQGLNKACLRFTLTFSDSQYFSDIEWTTGENNCAGTLINSPDTAKGLHSLFIEKKFCDVTIRTKEESFQCHKNVLCLQSAVFTAMLEADMKERATSIIHIDDLDSDTVRQMLHFIYTGNTDELNADSAMKLFAAADKYQITPMKDCCRNVLINNLTQQNTSCILSLADEFHDDELLESAMAFFSYHRKAILESETWKELKENNVRLALETMTKVCLKLFP